MVVRRVGTRQPAGVRAAAGKRAIVLLCSTAMAARIRGECWTAGERITRAENECGGRAGRMRSSSRAQQCLWLAGRTGQRRQCGSSGVMLRSTRCWKLPPAFCHSRCAPPALTKCLRELSAFGKRRPQPSSAHRNMSCSPLSGSNTRSHGRHCSAGRAKRPNSAGEFLIFWSTFCLFAAAVLICCPILRVCKFAGE